LTASERDEQARAAWREKSRGIDAKRFVILDETGSNLGLTPLYALAPRGKRAHGSIPRNRGKNTTMIASLTLAGMGPAMLLEGAMDSDAFFAYVEQVLVPTLLPNQIVVMDNLSSHTGASVRTLIEACGCQLWFLPAYSPDLSPMEQAFSKIKTFLRRCSARTQDALWDALSAAIDLITPLDAAAFFADCGYFPAPESG